MLKSVGGKVSIRLPVFSQAAAGRWPSWVTQMRGAGLFNVKPSLSEKAAGHLPLGPHQHRRRRTDFIVSCRFSAAGK